MGYLGTALILTIPLFIDKLKTGRLVKFWKEEKELAGLVALSLNKTIKQYPAAGWIRGNSVITNEVSVAFTADRKK